MGAGRVCRGGPSSAFPASGAAAGRPFPPLAVSSSASPSSAPSETASTSVTKTVNGSHHFKIAGYSLSKGIGVGKFIASESFNVGGFDWAIYFYPDGKSGEDGAAYVSLFIALASEGTDVRALFELTLVDQSGKGQDKVHNHFGRSLESGPYTLKYRGSMWGYKRFFKRTALETSNYLKDDCLLVNCTVGVVQSHTEGPKIYTIPVPRSSMALHIDQLLTCGKRTDIAFDVDGEIFPAHKVILSARSPVFRAQLFGPMKDKDMKSINIEDMEAPVFKKAEDEDKLSLLTDDVLLSILGRVDITTAARTSVLSTRWKHLPWLLPELTIDANDFLPAPLPNPIEAEHIDPAMASLTKAIRSFLAIHQHEKTTISSLKLKLYLLDNYSDIIGPLLSEAVGVGTVKDLNLAILGKEPEDCNDEDMLQQACCVDGFFSTYPGVLHCLTRLSLHNICFAEKDMNHLLFVCCKQLRYLYLCNCDTGGLPAWKIDAPDSNISVLELETCFLGKLEVLHLPKLERLQWDGWMCPNAPLSFGVVPALKELQLLSGAVVYFKGFNLSEVLKGTKVKTLTLNFQGEKLWLQPEGKQLCTVFCKLTKLCIHDIFVEFDLLWTIVLLEAAPSVEIFDVEIWEHPCTTSPEARGNTYGERTNPSWKLSEFTNGKEWLLKELQITGFSPLDQQMTFIRAVMKRAPNLRTLVLRDHSPCEDCKKMGALPRSERLPAERIFPKGKGEQDTVVDQLMGDMAYGHIDISFGI